LAKFHLLVFPHAAKMDDAALIRMMQIGASLFKSDIREEDTVNFKDIFKNLQSSDHSHLEQIADTITKSLIEDRGYYALLSIAGLLKLSLKVSFCCLCKQLQIIQYYIYNRLYYTRVGISCPGSIYRSLADNIVY
jgi:hypothetical protein